MRFQHSRPIRLPHNSVECGEAERAGHPIPVLDGLLAATAAVAGLTLATRNTPHMQHTGAVVFDPWTG